MKDRAIKPPRDIVPQDAEAAYTAEELKEAAEAAFGVRPEVMAGALRLAGKATLTRTQAKAAILAFLKRKV